MKQKSESPVSVFSFPSVLSKLQSGSLFTKTNLQSSFLISLSPVPLTLRKSLESPQLFLSYLEGFYKESGFEASKLQSASLKIEYLHALYLRVADKGGWAQVTGRDYWQNLALSYEVEPRKLREDYESFLLALERVSEEGNLKIPGQLLNQFSLKLMKSAEFVRPGPRPLSLDSTKIQNLFERLVSVVPALATLAFGINFKSWIGTWPHKNSPLEALAERNEEISGKILKSLHWGSEDNLFKYSNKVPGLTRPELNWIEDKKTFSCIGLKGVFKVWIVAEGQPEVFAFTKVALEKLNEVLKNDSNEVGLQAWTPSEEFLLSHEIEFFYIKLCIGDVMISQSQLTCVFIGESCIIDWALLPLFSVPSFAKGFFEDSSNLPFNFPLIVVEYLNQFIGEIDSETLEIFKKVINESIEDECWSGSYTLEPAEHLFCSSCTKALFWRYATYEPEPAVQNALCLKCQLIHPSPVFKYYEKFSPVELDTFLSRIESNIKSPIQTKLVKVPQACQIPGQVLQNSVILDPDHLKSHENSLILSKIQSSLDSAPLSHTQSEESYLRKGKKKIKISEFNDNKDKEDNKSECFSQEDFDEDLARRTRKGLKDKNKIPNGKNMK